MITFQELFFTEKEQCAPIARQLPAPIPPLALLVKNRYSLLSPGTELALWTMTHVGFHDPDIAWCKYPIKAGYASAGTVKETGSQVTRWKPGDRIAHFQTHADYSLFDPAKEIALPVRDDEELKLAPFARFGQIAYTAAQASSKTGPALVIGGGLVGNLCAQILHHLFGRQVILADVSNNRLALAKRCGLPWVLNSTDPGFEDDLKRITNGKGVDTVVDATGVPAVVSTALTLMNLHGETILLGSTRGNADLNVYKLIHRKFASLIGAHENRYPRFAEAGQPSHDAFARKVLAGIQAGNISVAPFITDIIKPSEINDAYRQLLDHPEEHIGVLIDWNL